MKKIVKKIFKFTFGSDDYILFKTNCSLFITAIMFFILGILSYENQDSFTTFTIISGFLFSIWLSIVQGADSAYKFICELIRFCFFFIITILSLYACLNYALDNNSVSTICVYLSCFCLLSCTYYLTSKAISIINFIKKIFFEFKTKLFNTTDPAPNKLKTLIENVTAFLVAIGGLTVAIKVITESIFQVLSYFK